MNRFTEKYWTERYQKNEIGWDAGAPTTPFVELFKSFTNKDLRILIPGCGNAYEGELLHQLGFTNVTLLDGSEKAKELFLERVPSFPKVKYVVGDFFALKGEFELILEQTFFCALEPILRPAYADKMFKLLAPEGYLKGVLFSFPLTEKGPPFGGSMEEYVGYFKPHFSICKIEPCTNSIKPREGNELFFSLQKPKN